MQEYTRCHLCRFHFQGTLDAYEKYCEEKAYIEKITSLINAKAQLYDFKPTQRVIGFCTYNTEKLIALTGCIYKQNLFLGFFSNTGKSISFSCDEQIDHRPFDKLETNIISGMHRAIRKEKSYIPLEIEAAWDECMPLLDAIISYETSVSLLPQEKREALYRSGKYCTNIENIICTFEAKRARSLSISRPIEERNDIINE